MECTLSMSLLKYPVSMRSLFLGEIENAQAKCGEEIAFPLTIKIASNYHDIRKDKHVE